VIGDPLLHSQWLTLVNVVINANEMGEGGGRADTNYQPRADSVELSVDAVKFTKCNFYDQFFLNM
jgi:hypothetical protein